ncbi:SLC13 family permease [Halalkalicoccus jeotgali]|uniref:Sodium/sulfate symporter n=1 Tax=Halalkalicoccus jeotgali (strain DSM 18796 / CECT 7217 / JCM 14584 / KCTC 4019 / B3) TaxID=795797 RepID=D8J520_HALJB|nr:SLC13 family permease [Halalkalicoccus jeotgali]ADJ13601.1 sodium/sulphate symporter [Halalkalicoccus jeotgali B3]ELY33377.1 sodium/sulfate symporter [Halalkalicoccus jeotgali B3]
MTLVARLDALRSPLPAFALAAAIGAIALVAAPLAADAATMLAITLFCIVLWVLTPVPPAYTGVICIGLVGAAFSTELALVGFRSPATWLIGFGLLIGLATRESGLADWAGRWLVARAVPALWREDPRRSYGALLVALCLGTLAFALLVPSTLVRVLVLAPVLYETGRFFEDRDARIGLFLGPLFATFYGASGIYTAALPNVIISGIAESVGDLAIGWTEWATVLFPVMGLARTVLVAGVVFALYRPAADSGVEVPEDGPGSAGGRERRMALFLLAGALFWMTDFLHGLHPVFGAILVVVLAFLPTVGVVEFSRAGDPDYSILFFLGGVFAVGEGLSQTGFADLAAGALFETIPADGSLALVLAFVFGATILLNLLMEGLAVASVLTPVLVSYASGTGLPLTPVVMTEALALGTYFFPYQSAVLVAILAQDGVEAGDLIRVTVACSLATILLLLPIQFGLFSILY